MNTENNKKYLLIFSGILLAYQYLGLVIDGNIPFTEIKIASQKNIPIILTILIIFFGTQFIFYWYKQKKKERSFFEFLTSIPVALIAILPVVYGYFLKFGIDWKTIVTSVFIMILGALLAISVNFIISIFFSLRSSKDMNEMGLGRIPSASKAFIRSLILLIPVICAAIILISKFAYLLPHPLQGNWLVIFLIPTLLLNFDIIINLFLCMGPSKIRFRALKKLRSFRTAMDLHEMHYQFIGIENHRVYKLPRICEIAKEGHHKEMQQLLKTGVDPNLQDARGWSPLIWASAEGHQSIVELLLEYGSDPNCINYLGRSAIMYASNYGFIDIVDALLKKGAIPNPSEEFAEHPPLSAAAHMGHLDVVKLLVENGANVNHKGKDKKTALDISMEAGHGDVAKYLRNIMLETDNTPPDEKTSLIKNLKWIDKNKFD
jgi:hypothetical protein